MTRFRIVPFILTSSLIAGCIADTEPEETTGIAQQALSGLVIYSRGTTDGADVDLNITDDNWSCFLAGVAGDLSQGVNSTNLGIWGRTAVAGAYVGANGHWFIAGHGGRSPQGVPYNNPVHAYVACVPGAPTARVNWQKSYTQQQVNAKDLGPTIGQMCFLSRVYGVGGSWELSDSSMRVVASGGHWWLYGHNVYGSNDAGYAGGDATCISTPSYLEPYQRTASPNDPGSTFNMIWSNNWDAACALRSVTGAFNQNSWTNGVIASWPQFNPGYWTMQYTGGKGFEAYCMK